MQGKDLNIEFKERTQEDKAKEVIEQIQTTIRDRKESVVKAEERLQKVLEKDIEDIKESDKIYSWDD